MALLASASVLASSPARADGAPAAPQDVPPARDLSSDPGASGAERPSRWYGWQLLVSDGAAIATYAAGVPLRSNVLIGTSLAVYLFDGSVVHAAHKRDRAMFLSLGLRAALPVIGALATVLLLDGPSSCRNTFFAESCGVADVYLGANVAMLAAMAIDDAALSWQRAPVEASEPGETRSMRLIPLFTATTGPDRHGTPLVGFAAVF